MIWYDAQVRLSKGRQTTVRCPFITEGWVPKDNLHDLIVFVGDESRRALASGGVQFDPLETRASYRRLVTFRLPSDWRVEGHMWLAGAGRQLWYSAYDRRGRERAHIMVTGTRYLRLKALPRFSIQEDVAVAIAGQAAFYVLDGGAIVRCHFEGPSTERTAIRRRLEWWLAVEQGCPYYPDPRFYWNTVLRLVH